MSPLRWVQQFLTKLKVAKEVVEDNVGRLTPDEARRYFSDPEFRKEVDRRQMALVEYRLKHQPPEGGS